MSEPLHHDPILCHCFQVTRSTIQDCVTLLGASSVRDVRNACGAGGGCMACRHRIQSVIDARHSAAARISQFPVPAAHQLADLG